MAGWHDGKSTGRVLLYCGRCSCVGMTDLCEGTHSTQKQSTTCSKPVKMGKNLLLRVCYYLEQHKGKLIVCDCRTMSQLMNIEFNRFYQQTCFIQYEFTDSTSVL